MKSQPSWESYGPTPENEKPLSRSNHVSVATEDQVIMFVRLAFLPSPLVIILCRFGGFDGHRHLNDTWSFNISTRKWTELQCTGSIPSPCDGHAAVLVDDVMYVFGGYWGGTFLDDLIALQLSSG